MKAAECRPWGAAVVRLGTMHAHGVCAQWSNLLRHVHQLRLHCGCGRLVSRGCVAMHGMRGTLCSAFGDAHLSVCT